MQMCSCKKACMALYGQKSHSSVKLVWGLPALRPLETVP